MVLYSVGYWGNPPKRAICSLRDMLGASVEQLARACDIDAETLSRVELGIEIPTLHAVANLSALFCLEPDFLMMDDSHFNALLRSEVFAGKVYAGIEHAERRLRGGLE